MHARPHARAHARMRTGGFWAQLAEWETTCSSPTASTVLPVRSKWDETWARESLAAFSMGAAAFWFTLTKLVSPRF